MDWNLSCLLPPPVDASKFAPHRYLWPKTHDRTPHCSRRHPRMPQRILRAPESAGVEGRRPPRAFGRSGEPGSRQHEGDRPCAGSAPSISLLGNHELRLLKFRKTGDRKYMKEHDLETFDSLRHQDWAYLESMAAHL